MPLRLRTLTEFHLLSRPLRYDPYHMGKPRHKEVKSFAEDLELVDVGSRMRAGTNPGKRDKEMDQKQPLPWWKFRSQRGEISEYAEQRVNRCENAK